MQNMVVFKMTFKIDEVFECTGERDNSCFILGCVYYSKKENKFVKCKHFKLKDGYSIYKK